MIYFFEYSRHILKQKIGVSDKIVMIKNFALIQLKFHVKRIRLKLKKHKKLKLVSEVSKLNCGKTLLYKKIDRLNIIEKPNIFRSDKNLSILKGKSPNIEVWFLNTCKVISRTSSLVYNNCIYNNYLSKMEILHDLKNPLGQNINSITKKNVSLSISKYLEKKDEYIYIHLLNEHSHNYYHFMFETLPKFIVICEYLKNNDKDNNLPFILLLDENIPYQFLEVIDYFATIKYEIEFVPKYCMIECKNLIFCTDFWNSLDNTRFTSSIVNEFFVDRFAIETIKNKLNLKTTIPYRKIYLQRKSKQARYLSNTNELEELLKSLNFECILPETLSLQEQIQIFSESKIVIGTSGAVFSNIIFMQEYTNAIIFSPDTVASNYYIFQPMADVANVNLVHILTKNSLHDSIHANSSIDVNEVSEVLNNLVEL